MFKMWGTLHIIFIMSPFIFTIVAHLLLKNKSYEQKRKMGIYFSIVAVIILMLRNAEILVKNGYTIDPEIIPLQICHFANFVLLIAFLTDNKVLFTLAFCLNLPAATLSIIFADSLTNYRTLFSFRAQAYLWGHMLIVGITLWALLNDFIIIKLKTWLKTIVLMLTMYITSIPINNILTYLTGKEANYFYSIKPEEGTPLEAFYKFGNEISFLKLNFNPVYLLLTILCAVIILLTFYGIYQIYYYYKKTYNNVQISNKKLKTG